MLADKVVELQIVPRKNSQLICPKCGKKCPTYDTEHILRRFEFVLYWKIPVFFAYKNIAAKMRCVTCQERGIITEQVLFHALGNLSQLQTAHRFW